MVDALGVHDAEPRLASRRIVDVVHMCEHLLQHQEDDSAYVIYGSRSFSAPHGSERKTETRREEVEDRQTEGGRKKGQEEEER